jgi:hypothetical protein
MEAMSVEMLLLSAWEEDGFVGKTRIPVGLSDVDALAVRPIDGAVRIGESKVREGCNLVYPVDEQHLAAMAAPGTGFDWWLTSDEWCAWLDNLPLLWSATGAPEVPWLPPLHGVSSIEVVFLCNLWVFGDAAQADAAMRRTAVDRLRSNPAVAAAMNSGKLRVSGQVKPTGIAVQDLFRAVRTRISRDGYTRRFGEPVKDVVRELNRYLHPQIQRIPRDAAGDRVDTRKEISNFDIRRATVLGVLDALGVTEADLLAMLNG